MNHMNRTYQNSKDKRNKYKTNQVNTELMSNWNLNRLIK